MRNVALVNHLLTACLALVFSFAPSLAHVPDLSSGQVPTLAPLVREVTPAVVNISVHGKVREDNPLYKDSLFREFSRCRSSSKRR